MVPRPGWQIHVAVVERVVRRDDKQSSATRLQLRTRRQLPTEHVHSARAAHIHCSACLRLQLLHEGECRCLGVETLPHSTGSGGRDRPTPLSQPDEAQRRCRERERRPGKKAIVHGRRLTLSLRGSRRISNPTTPLATPRRVNGGSHRKRQSGEGSCRGVGSSGERQRQCDVSWPQHGSYSTSGDWACTEMRTERW